MIVNTINGGIKETDGYIKTDFMNLAFDFAVTAPPVV